MLPLWTLIIPTVTALLCFFLKKIRVIEWVHLVGSSITSILAIWLVCEVAVGGTVSSNTNQFFYVDALGSIVIAIVAIIGWTAALNSIGYIRNEYHEGVIDQKQLRQYYFWYHLFIASMLMVCVVNNMGLLWVGIEATTIVSAFLVALYRKGEALEAAWKYLMICGAGIAIALLGVILLYSSVVNTLGTSPEVLNWSFLKDPSIKLQPSMVSLSFVFLIVGLGTKIGFAPLHFWLPDAHSQAPSPISAVLSGVLLNCALLVLIRFAVIAEHTISGDVIRHLFIGFGLLSIAVAFPFIMVQQDLKRMLAFSTIEHMGIIAVAIGIGGVLGFTAALLQMFNHSMAKSLLFLTSGNMIQKYKSKQMTRITGGIKTMPITGFMLLVSSLAITGVPPLNLFTSEFSIISVGFSEGHPIVVSFMIAWLALIFGAMLFHISKMVFGTSRDKLAVGDLSRWSTLPLLLPFVFVVVFGVYIPPVISDLIHQAAIIMGG
ncbi:hydrogenase 4 subunit F [Neobacillus sp. PS3-40]|uniref:hydrogenase 4 subunit F n=1 Tax=Neobacillus sp. PS3-40 TaxID=3070679 RepID=UPI0027DF6820|nr:hydrogenase 4 subunit F [Neobacillus sp. PS3-40]WML44863.1 hydrogenase 4 subunit F [Neobacillus sp. PS3-40]